MLGGIVADFARNPEIAVLPEDVQRGVRLHRQIDGFTDSHPIVHRSMGRVTRQLGWFAGIVIDIYYDHILARHWKTYSSETLSDFSSRAYRTLNDQWATAPPDAQGFIRTFIDHDLIAQYATREGIAETLARVSRVIAIRIPKRAIWLPEVLPDLCEVHEELSADFHTFYPDLLAFVMQQRLLTS